MKLLASSKPRPSYRSLVICAGLVVGMTMGCRHVQGLFMLPLLADKGWDRESFSLALGLQVLVWGLLQPATGLLADKFGVARVIAGGCVLYALGLLIEALAASTTALMVGAGFVIGVGLTASTFAVVYGGLSRMVAPERRGTAQGVAGGVAGLVQFLLVPATQLGIGTIGWSASLQVLAAVTLLCGATAWIIDDRHASGHRGLQNAAEPAVGPVVRAAIHHSGFWLLNLGFISCGFQLAFLGTHLPAYLKDAGLGTSDGVNAIAIIALANVVGTYACGRLGDFYRHKYLLSLVYLSRTVAMIAFVALPLSPLSVNVFAFVMGATWLGTVPLTNGVLATIFGVRYLGTLFGLVFLGHQLGGFLGAWLGGVLYDSTQSYALMWAIAIALGAASVVLNLPIRDRSIEHELMPAAA